MSESTARPTLPPARVLWGRVATAIVVVLLAFGLGRCSAEGVPEDDVTALEGQVADLQSTNEQLRAQVDRLDEQLTASQSSPSPSPSTEAPSAPTTDPTTTPAEGEPGGTWTVGPGDTLHAIAIAVYGDRTRAELVAAANGLDTSDTLQVGQVLQLPIVK